MTISQRLFSTRVVLCCVCAALVQCKSAPLTPESSDVAAAPLIVSAEAHSDRQKVEAFGSRFAVSTQGIHATAAAKEIFAKSHNIVDAMVAASFVISVERPQSTGIGGGGFVLFREAKTGEVHAIDFRERAPLKASEKMYVGPDGTADMNKSRNGVLSAATPGLIAGLIEIHQKFGKLPLKDVIAPAIRVAEEGFAVYPQLYRALEARASILAKDPSARALFLDDKGNALPVGHILVQKDLGRTLRLIAQKGRSVFYKGEIAKSITEFMKKEKGLITKEDMRRYQVKWRKPLRSTFRGYEVVAMPPPSSGGVHVIQFLNMLEKDDLKSSGFFSARALHMEATAFQSIYADRAHYMGDTDFVKVPVERLISKEYSEQRRKEFVLDRARKASEVSPGKVAQSESLETTHMSFMDSEGNAISTTQTVNGWMGAAVVVPGTGILLNNEMDDFSAQVGSSNLFGAIGGKPNAIAAEKTPLSSMSPTLLLKDGKPWLAIGAPGGTRIISCTAQAILNVVEFGMPLYDAIRAARVHHQWLPDVLTLDPPGPSEITIARLKKMGYEVEVTPIGCTVMAVQKDQDKLHAVADPRDIGTSAAE